MSTTPCSCTKTALSTWARCSIAASPAGRRKDHSTCCNPRSAWVLPMHGSHPSTPPGLLQAQLVAHSQATDCHERQRSAGPGDWPCPRRACPGRCSRAQRDRWPVQLHGFAPAPTSPQQHTPELLCVSSPACAGALFTQVALDSWPPAFSQLAFDDLAADASWQGSGFLVGPQAAAAGTWHRAGPLRDGLPCRCRTTLHAAYGGGALSARPPMAWCAGAALCTADWGPLSMPDRIFSSRSRATPSPTPSSRCVSPARSAAAVPSFLSTSQARAVQAVMMRSHASGLPAMPLQQPRKCSCSSRPSCTFWRAPSAAMCACRGCALAAHCWLTNAARAGHADRQQHHILARGHVSRLLDSRKPALAPVRLVQASCQQVHRVPACPTARRPPSRTRPSSACRGTCSAVCVPRQLGCWCVFKSATWGSSSDGRATQVPYAPLVINAASGVSIASNNFVTTACQPAAAAVYYQPSWFTPGRPVQLWNVDSASISANGFNAAPSPQCPAVDVFALIAYGGNQHRHQLLLRCKQRPVHGCCNAMQHLQACGPGQCHKSHAPIWAGCSREHCRSLLDSGPF